ncbi:MAG: 2-amino-4-hydroxy-6-hydroxymethyldihydropteridine diphosphokinase [Bacteroidota bacterium]
MRNGIFLLLGSNMGDRLQMLASATQQIGYFANIKRCSSVYVTAAWGNVHQPDFLNQVLEVETLLTPEELLTNILSVETHLGRERNEKWGSRTLDIDILLFHDVVLKTPTLTLPHPELPHRRFALAPLCELAPEAIHPVLKKTFHQLLTECPDKLEVNKL